MRPSYEITVPARYILTDNEYKSLVEELYNAGIRDALRDKVNLTKAEYESALSQAREEGIKSGLKYDEDLTIAHNKGFDLGYQRGYLNALEDIKHDVNEVIQDAINKRTKD
jgi:flagellar biosynthesis/type III secretory pathway protein FliH